jgi:hypothetical protein
MVNLLLILHFNNMLKLIIVDHIDITDYLFLYWKKRILCRYLQNE